MRYAPERFQRYVRKLYNSGRFAEAYALLKIEWEPTLEALWDELGVKIGSALLPEIQRLAAGIWSVIGKDVMEQR